MGMYETTDHPPAVAPQQVIHYYHYPMEYNGGSTTEPEDSRRTPSPAVHGIPSGYLHQDHGSPVATSSSSSSSPTNQAYHYHQGHTMAMAPPPVTSVPYVPHMMPGQPVAAPGAAPPHTTGGWVVAPATPTSNVPHVVSSHEVDAAHYPPTPTSGGAPAAAAPNPGHSPTGGNAAAATTNTTKQKTVVAAKKRYSKTGSRGSSTNTSSGGSSDKQKGDSVTARRQKRLERNRESARLSRRRRKQYLEVLEDRVTHLSIEMDRGRREHAAKAIETVLAKRQEILRQQGTQRPEDGLARLEMPLSRTSSELMVLSTFTLQQLKSFSLAPHTKFVMWLTLQGDTYYRGGRAASERLSAARIGERMLQSGNDRVPPAHSMWPLFCNEVGLSYDQEERVRNYQRTLLQTPESWLDRHTGRASGLAMQSLHDGINCVAGRMRHRERSMLRGLTAEQRLKFLTWAEKNESRIKTKLAEKKAKTPKAPKQEKYETSDKHHLAANLYILNNRLQEMIASFPKTYPMVSAAYLKRLARRPSFESLGHQKEEAARALCRDESFASSGSLKRVSSSMSMEDQDKPHPQQVSPEDGQEASRAVVEKELGFVKEIIPPYTPPTIPQVQHAAVPPVPIPSPTPVESTSSYHQYAAPPPTAQAPMAGAPPHPGHQVMHYAPHPGAQPVVYAAAPVSHYQPVVQYQQHQIPVQHHVHQAGAPAPHTMHVVQPPQYYAPPLQVTSQPPHHHTPTMAQSQPAPAPQPMRMPSNQAPAPQATSSAPPPAPSARTHGRASSFLPPHLNVVPEEMFPSGESAEEIFMSLMDEDWAIGEGVDMDTAA